jgi:hypothetical protein
MGIHTGTPHVAEEGYVGFDVHRAARIAAAGHGGQVLVSDSTAALHGTGGLRDLGEHRLKDLSAPERIYQLGDDDFPPLKSLHQTNLPVPATPFLGRERELAELIVLQEDARLLTLTGAGGTGKTRARAPGRGRACRPARRLVGALRGKLCADVDQTTVERLENEPAADPPVLHTAARTSCRAGATCGSSPSSWPWRQLYAPSSREAAERSKLLGLALRPEPRPKARKPPTRSGRARR